MLVMVVLYAGLCVVCESCVLIIWAHSVDYNKLRRVSVIIIRGSSRGMGEGNGHW